MQGRVKRFDANRFYGFIGTEAGDFFFHGSDVTGDILAGDTVDFWLTEASSNRGGLQAVEVQRHVPFDEVSR